MHGLVAVDQDEVLLDRHHDDVRREPTFGVAQRERSFGPRLALLDPTKEDHRAAIMSLRALGKREAEKLLALKGMTKKRRRRVPAVG